MNRKLKLVLKVINNVGEEDPETKDYIEENMKKYVKNSYYIEENMNEICVKQHITVEEVIDFVIFV